MTDRNTIILTSTVITTAVTGTTTTPIDVPLGTKSINFFTKFVYGSGGTTAKFWYQTTFDGGATWQDMSNHALTTASLNKTSGVNLYAALTPATPTDATLADNTNTSGAIGSQIRVKYTTTGTYAASTTVTGYVQFA